MRKRSKPWADREFEENERLIRTPEQLKGKWHEKFDGTNTKIKPLHLEIGCGKGTFITETAKLNPDINYVAFEKEDQVISTAMRLARESGADKNILFICADAADITDYFGEGEVNRIYINFCDPWRERKKWERRRLTHRGFLAKYLQILDSEKAEIFFKTDNEVLFDFSVTEFTETGWKLSNVTRDLHNSGFVGNIMTEYEQRFSEKGMPIYRLEARK